MKPPYLCRHCDRLIASRELECECGEDIARDWRSPCWACTRRLFVSAWWLGLSGGIAARFLHWPSKPFGWAVGITFGTAALWLVMAGCHYAPCTRTWARIGEFGFGFLALLASLTLPAVWFGVWLASQTSIHF